MQCMASAAPDLRLPSQPLCVTTSNILFARDTGIMCSTVNVLPCESSFSSLRGLRLGLRRGCAGSQEALIAQVLNT